MRNEEEILGDNSTKHFPCVSSVTHPPLRSRLSGRPSALRERGQPRMRTVNSGGQVILTGGGAAFVFGHIVQVPISLDIFTPLEVS